MKTSLSLPTLFTAGLLCGGAVLADTETVEKTFKLPNDGSLSLKNVNGTIVIGTWEGGGVKMVAEKSANSQAGLEGIQINTRESGDRLEITTELPTKRSWFGGTKNYRAKVNYTLHVPESLNLRKVESVNGSVTIAGVQGGVRVSTVNGSITARQLNGSIDLETVNGAVKCETLTSGSDDRIEISTVNGSVELGVSKSINGDLAVSTVNGSIKSDVPFTQTNVQSRRKLRAQLGDGGVSIDLNTVNGSVRLRSAETRSVSFR